MNQQGADYAQLEIAIDSSVVARASIIASVASTSSYSQAKVKALPKFLQRDAYLKALYLVAREFRPACAMQFCTSGTAEMADDQLHVLITSPKELKKCLRAFEKTARPKTVQGTVQRSRLHESDDESAGSGSEMSDYNHFGSSSSDDDSSSSDDDSSSSDEDGESSVVNESGSSEASSDGDDESGSHDGSSSGSDSDGDGGDDDEDDCSNSDGDDNSSNDDEYDDEDDH